MSDMRNKLIGIGTKLRPLKQDLRILFLRQYYNSEAVPAIDDKQRDIEELRSRHWHNASCVCLNSTNVSHNLNLPIQELSSEFSCQK